MHASPIFALATLFLGAIASPTSGVATRDGDDTLIIVKAYANADTCEPGQTPDDYNDMVFGYESQLDSGKCQTFQSAGAEGWDGLKVVAKYKGAYNYTAYAYTTVDCVDNGDAIFLGDSICHSATAGSGYLSWNLVKVW